MSRLSRHLPALLALLLSAAWLQATPLVLDYVKSDHGNGLVYYTFTLTLQNHDSSWAPGQSFGWVIFGDSPTVDGSVFTDFTYISGNGPWSETTMVTGAHNGVLLGPTNLMWTPTQVGDSIVWHGSATRDVPDGTIRFSTLSGLGGAVPATFAPTGPQAPPEPGPLVTVPTSDTSSSSSSSSGSGSSGSGSSGSGGGDPQDPLATPEPATIALAALALLSMAARRKA
jgi:uncharacterized membrane protein YgcG